MLKVFLVEDESIMREGLRDNIPWEQFGYSFVGEASDGEMALPLIRKLRPDVLITDIKMPFMDGLELAGIVSKELPSTKIVIISGYDDFEYARQAIRIGVDQYLLKPITRSALQEVLTGITAKIETEKEQTADLRRFQEEYQEYEQLAKRHFFEKIFSRKLSFQEIFEEAQKQSLDLNAESYAVSLVYFSDNQEELVRFFYRFKEYIIFRWNIDIYCILLLCESNAMEAMLERLKQNVERIAGEKEGTQWYVALSNSVNRLSMVPDCYNEANSIFSYRFLLPERHVLTADVLEVGKDRGGNYVEPDLEKIDPDIIKGFLGKGQKDEIEAFVTGYLSGLSNALKSSLFKNYLLLNVRFATLAFIEAIGVKKDDFIAGLNEETLTQMSPSDLAIKEYIVSLFEQAIKWRDEENAASSKVMLSRVIAFIDENFANESMSLNEAAAVGNVSPAYLSAVFSSEMDLTFVEYVTKKRMEAAKKLLKTTSLHTHEIAAKVGYKDQHYFSVVFKKTVGVSPREYRG